LTEDGDFFGTGDKPGSGGQNIPLHPGQGLGATVSIQPTCREKIVYNEHFFYTR
jgi:hypothetical protein